MTTLPAVTASPLEEAEAEAAFAAILDGTLPDEAIAPFLVALAERGETAPEIAGAARAMRARMIPISAPPNAIDVCGTGGDGHHTLNVSTAVSLVVAACGVPVAKHGNRAASSKSGAADRARSSRSRVAAWLPRSSSTPRLPAVKSSATSLPRSRDCLWPTSRSRVHSRCCVNPFLAT